MAFPNFTRLIADSKGNALPGISCTITEESSGNPARCFNDRNGSTRVDTNGVVTTNNSGYLTFYAQPGFYKIVASYSGLTQTLRYQQIEKLFDTTNISAASYTLAENDAGNYLRTTQESSGVIIEVPLFASVPFVDETEIAFRQAGAGQITLVGETGVTINAPYLGSLQSAGEGATMILKNVAQDEWDLIGHTA